MVAGGGAGASVGTRPGSPVLAVLGAARGILRRAGRGRGDLGGRRLSVVLAVHRQPRSDDDIAGHSANEPAPEFVWAGVGVKQLVE